MTPADILESAASDGVVLALSDAGKLLCSGDKEAVTQWSPILRENRAAIVVELDRARRHAKVLEMLGNGRKYAVLVEHEDSDPVIATVAIKGVAIFDMAIPRHSYNGLVLLALIEKHSECREVKQ